MAIQPKFTYRQLWKTTNFEEVEKLLQEVEVELQSAEKTFFNAAEGYQEIPAEKVAYWRTCLDILNTRKVELSQPVQPKNSGHDEAHQSLLRRLHAALWDNARNMHKQIVEAAATLENGQTIMLLVRDHVTSQMQGMYSVRKQLVIVSDARHTFGAGWYVVEKPKKANGTHQTNIVRPFLGFGGIPTEIDDALEGLFALVAQPGKSQSGYKRRQLRSQARRASKGGTIGIRENQKKKQDSIPSILLEPDEDYLIPENAKADKTVRAEAREMSLQEREEALAKSEQEKLLAQQQKAAAKRASRIRRRQAQLASAPAPAV